jgi:hypothetical protein
MPKPSRSRPWPENIGYAEEAKIELRQSRSSQLASMPDDVAPPAAAAKIRREIDDCPALADGMGWVMPLSILDSRPATIAPKVCGAMSQIQLYHRASGFWRWENSRKWLWLDATNTSAQVT